MRAWKLSTVFLCCAIPWSVLAQEGDDSEFVPFEAPVPSPEVAPPAGEQTPPAEIPAPAPEEATPAPEEAAPAPEQPVAPPTEPEPAPPPQPAWVEPAVGDEIEGWKIVSFIGEKRLIFDGRPTEDVCGYLRDVIVERQGEVEPGAASKLKKAVLQVACARYPQGLGPGPRKLELVQAEAAPAKDAWSPVEAGRLTQQPALVTGSDVLPAPSFGSDAQPLEGQVILEIEITRAGATRGVKVIQSGGFSLLDDEATSAAQGFTWKPGELNGAPVDTVIQRTVFFKVGAAAAGAEAASTTTAHAEQAASATAKHEPYLGEPEFYKGELSSLGVVQLVNARSSAGIGFGTAFIDGVFYAAVRPDFNLHIDDFSLGLGTPLRFELFDTNPIRTFQPDTWGKAFDHLGRFRSADWDRALVYPFTDLVRPIKFVSWGRKEDRLYVDVNRVYALTLGHGQLMRRYAPNVDVDESNLFAEVDGYLDYGGFELIAGPVPVPRIVGVLGFVKPLSFFADDMISRSLSLGLSWVSDLNAPTQLVTTKNPLAFNRPEYPIEEGRFIYTNRDSFVGHTVNGIGVDTEIKVLKLDTTDIKVYADYSHLLFPGVPEADIAPFSGGGFALGSLIRLNFGAKSVRDLKEESAEVQAGQAPREARAVHAMRFRVEARTFHPQFLPSYFNALYEHDKYQFGFGDVSQNQRATLPTKIAYLSGRANDPWRLGYFLEASYALVDWLALTAVYEDAWQLGGDIDAPEGRSVILHAETQGLGFFQLFTTYHYRNFRLEDWGKLLQFSTDNEILYMGARLQVLILALNFGLQRDFKVAFLPEDMGSRAIEKGGPVYPHSSVGLQNQWNVFFDIEIGWQF